MSNRIEIEKVENGFKVCTYTEKEQESKDGGMMYPDYERKEYVATDPSEVMKYVNEFMGSATPEKGGTLLGGAQESE